MDISKVFVTPKVMQGHLVKILKMMRARKKVVLIYQNEKVVACMMSIEEQPGILKSVERPTDIRVADDWYFVQKYLENENEI